MPEQQWKTKLQEAYASKAFERLLETLTGSVQKDAPMSHYTSWKIGGPADYLIAPANVEELCQVVAFAKGFHIPITIIGKGTNLLVSDAGIAGIVLQIGEKLQKLDFLPDNMVRAEAGLPLATLAKTTVKNGLVGLEWAVGIPGNLGGALMMNAGAYGYQMGQFVTNIEVVEYTVINRNQTADVLVERNTIPQSELDFCYRNSGLKPNQIAVAATLSLQQGDVAQAEKSMRDLLKTRSKNQPLEYPSAGSVFKNPPGDHAGRLSEAAGCKGMTVGGAQVSEKHGNFIINRGNATAADVLALIAQVQAKVKAQFGIELETEVRQLGRFV